MTDYYINDTYNRPSEERDTRDLAMLALGTTRLDRCPGGRYNIKGFVCMHCGTDYEDPDNGGFCGQPVDTDGFTPFDTTVARRVMLESAQAYGEDS